MDQQEQGFGTLKPGWARVQFCLFDANTGPQPTSPMTFLRVA